MVFAENPAASAADMREGLSPVVEEMAAAFGEYLKTLEKREVSLDKEKADEAKRV